MKAAAILVTAALAVGTGAVAQTREGSGESVGQKADRIFDRMENATKRGIDKVRGTGSNAKNEAKQEGKEAKREAKQESKEAKREAKQDSREARREAQRDDTRTMGAGNDKMRDRSDQRAGSGDRQARMDDAYGNWKHQQKR